MSYIDDIFRRATLTQIQSFLLYGAERLHEPCPNYEAEMKSAAQGLHEMLGQFVLDEKAREDLLNQINLSAALSDEAYFQLGMKAGALLTTELHNPTGQIG